MPPSRKLRIRRAWPVLTVFISIAALQLLVAVASIDMMSAVRAYSTGESLYSKGQKDAQIQLIEYAEFHREADYQRFLAALAVPLGDRAAREALLQTPPDVEAARLGLLAGGTHPDDIPGVIRLFRWFHDTPLMSRAVATWAEGDGAIEEMRLLGERAHARILAGELGAPEVTDLRSQAVRLNERLTDLEVRFADELGKGARLSQSLVLGLNLSLAVALGMVGIGFILHSFRRQAENEGELRRRKESLQRLLDSTAEGLFGVDTSGRFTFVNKAALAMLGYDTESELLGRDMEPLIHRAGDGQSLSANAEITKSYREHRELHAVDERFWRRDGTSFPVEFWSHPIVEEGEQHGAVATFFDITERKNMLAALRQGEVRMAGLVDAVNDAVLTIDEDERVVLFNRAAERLFGVPSEAAIGTPVQRFIPLSAQGRAVPRGPTPRLSEMDTGPGGAVRELTGRRPDGRTFPLEASFSRLDTEHGALITAVLRDATDLQSGRKERQAREALEASSQAKTEFLSRMSHELRTPLNAVLGFSQLLRIDAAEPPTLQQLDRIQRIEDAGAHLLALVNDVLDLSRVESGQLTVSLEPVDIRSAVIDALSMVAPLAAGAGVRTRVSGPEDDLLASEDDSELSVVADRLRLRQILVNFLSNAVKYNRRGGEVRVGWRLVAGRCEVRVQDEGAGMGPEKLERLFEPFNRLGAEKSRVEGTGIGLVLSRRLAELMGGEVRIESAIGSGTTASVTLGVSREAAAQPLVVSPPSQHGEFDDALRVLYAEDNEVNVEIVRQVLHLRPSISLDIAVSGAQAFERARLAQPELILVDMNLGDMTGIELARALRSDPATAGIRLVALSADALPEQISAALAEGFEDYLTKPVDFRDLLDVLDGRRGERSAVHRGAVATHWATP